MENKNLNDIVIEDADSSKKTQLKNILTLLALLFIILVISIVITRLILGSDEESSDPTMVSTTTELNKSDDTSLSHAATAATAAAAGAGVALAANSLRDKSPATTSTTASDEGKKPLLTERNTSSRTKRPLRDQVEEERHAAAKKAPVTSNSTPKKVSTYTRPKYVVTKTPTHTKEPVRPAASATRGYYIKVGAFKDATTAIKNIKSIKLNYKTTKTKNGLVRVLIGPFYSHKDAQDHLAKARAHVAKDAYITKIK